MVGDHHLPEDVIVHFVIWLHHVNGDFMHVHAAALDPSHCALRDAHGLLPDVHVVVRDAERLGDALEELDFVRDEDGSAMRIVQCVHSEQTEGMLATVLQWDHYERTVLLLLRKRMSRYG
mgnify:CR=1 FL=1